MMGKNRAKWGGAIGYTSSLSPKASSLKRIWSLHSNMAREIQSQWSTRPATNNTVIDSPVNIVTLIKKVTLYKHTSACFATCSIWYIILYITILIICSCIIYKVVYNSTINDIIILSAPMTRRCPKQPARCCKTPSDSLLSPLQSTNAVYRTQYVYRFQSKQKAHTYNTAQAMARVTPAALTKVPK